MKKSAFTLAEVLITLGVIGVVAALTLPTLVGNYQKQSLVSQLKKSHSVLSQGLARVMADEKAVNFAETNFYSKCKSYQGYECKNEFVKYFQTDDNYNTGSYYYDSLRCSSYSNCLKSGSTSAEYTQGTSFYLNDGARVFVSNKGDDLYFAVDVNGKDKPNVQGRDLFVFRVSSTGDPKLIPINFDYGVGARRIMEDGWEMNY